MTDFDQMNEVYISHFTKCKL